MLFWIRGDVRVPREKTMVWMPKGLMKARRPPAPTAAASAVSRRRGMVPSCDRQASTASPATKSPLMMTPTTNAECRFAQTQMKGGSIQAWSRPARYSTSPSRRRPQKRTLSNWGRAPPAGGRAAGARGAQPGRAQQQVEAVGGRRDPPAEDGNQPGQAARLKQQVH